jgi:hypothetical protein
MQCLAQRMGMGNLQRMGPHQHRPATARTGHLLQLNTDGPGPGLCLLVLVLVLVLLTHQGYG